MWYKTKGTATSLQTEILPLRWWFPRRKWSFLDFFLVQQAYGLNEGSKLFGTSDADDSDVKESSVTLSGDGTKESNHEWAMPA
jgi:hypothetical protein